MPPYRYFCGAVRKEAVMLLAFPSADSRIPQWFLILSCGKVTAIRKAAWRIVDLHAGCARFIGAIRSERSCNEPDVFYVRDYRFFSGMVVA